MNTTVPASPFLNAFTLSVKSFPFNPSTFVKPLFPLESAFSAFDESFLSFPSDFAETLSNFFLASSLNPIVNSLLSLRLTVTSPEPLTLTVSVNKFTVFVVVPVPIFNVDALLEIELIASCTF